jgi:hypothetical protein
MRTLTWGIVTGDAQHEGGRQMTKDNRELLEKQLLGIAWAMDDAGDDSGEVERLSVAFDAAFTRLAKNELAQGRERPTAEDCARMLSAYCRRY